MKIILSEQEQEELIKSISKASFITIQESTITSFITDTLRTLQNEIIPLFNEASEHSESALKYNLDYMYNRHQGMAGAYKTVIELIDKYIQKVEKGDLI